jgi:periplasmic copper chaperone A
MIKRREFLTASGSMLGGAALGLFTANKPATAHEYEIGKLKIEHPWLRAPKDGETTAYFYGFFHNNGDTPDKLVAVKSPSVGKVDFYPDAAHASPDGITLPAKKKTTLRPGGPHVVFSDITKHLEVGWGFELILVFEKAGEVTIDAAIDAPDAKHAHDAEAIQRWEKAHGKDSAGPATSAEQEHVHHEMGHEHGEAPPQPKK